MRRNGRRAEARPARNPGARRWLRRTAAGAVAVATLVGVTQAAPAAGAAAGRTEAITYHSAIFNMNRRMQVYLPPNYNPRVQYPVLYLLGGACEDDTGWLAFGNLRRLMDTAINTRKAKPMIVAMPNGRVGTQFREDISADPMPHEVLDSVIPALAARHRIRTDPYGQALAGISQGAAQAIDMALVAPGKFRMVGAWSYGLEPQMLATPALSLKELDAKIVNRGLDTLDMSMGDEDTIAPVSEYPTLALFQTLEIKHQYRAVTGGHAWPKWDNDLNYFLPKLYPVGRAAPIPGPVSPLSSQIVGNVATQAANIAGRLGLPLPDPLGYQLTHCIANQDTEGTS